MRLTRENNLFRSGFITLTEALVVLVISVMIMSTAISMYTMVRKTEAKITDTLHENSLTREITQRIAEDIDRLTVSADDLEFKIENKMQDGKYEGARLTMTSRIFNRENEPVVYESITWQTSPAFESEYDGLVLYRSHSGYALEDKMLQQDIEQRQREKFVPVCEGITHFKIVALMGSSEILIWNRDNLPYSVRISISFDPPEENLAGRFEVPEEYLSKRTVAVNRTRNIRFGLSRKSYAMLADILGIDPNELALEYDPNEIDPNDIDSLQPQQQPDEDEGLEMPEDDYDEPEEE